MNAELIGSFIKRHLRLTVILSVVSGILSYFLITLFPGMDIVDAKSISASWPQIMIDLFGDPLYGFRDIYAWMHLQLFHITLWVIFGVFASLLASDIVAKEMEEKSMDILLSTPVGRASIVLCRLTGIAVILAAAMIPVAAGCILGVCAIRLPLRMGMILTALLVLFLTSLVFAAATVLISVFIPRRTYAAFTTIAIFGGLFLYEELLIKLVPFLGKFAFIDPFHYYKPQDILIYNSFSPADPVILVLFFAIAAVLSVLAFTRRDILL
jgi:ABC-2 type transport system permease protein